MLSSRIPTPPASQAAQRFDSNPSIQSFLPTFLVVKGNRKSIPLGLYDQNARFLAQCCKPVLCCISPGLEVIVVRMPDPAMSYYGPDPVRSLFLIKRLWRFVEIITRVRPTSPRLLAFGGFFVLWRLTTARPLEQDVATPNNLLFCDQVRKVMSEEEMAERLEDIDQAIAAGDDPCPPSWPPSTQCTAASTRPRRSSLARTAASHRLRTAPPSCSASARNMLPHPR